MAKYKPLKRRLTPLILCGFATTGLMLPDPGLTQTAPTLNSPTQVQTLTRLQFQAQALDDRLILSADGRLSATLVAPYPSPWQVRADYQIQSLWADDLSSLPLALTNDDQQLFNLTQTLVDHQQNLTRHRLDRLMLSYTQTYYSVHLGRQALSWGQGTVFNPLDLFNPFSPTAWDTEYKPGIDMFYTQWLMDSGDDFSLLWIPRRNTTSNNIATNQSTFAAFWRHYAPIETHLMLAQDYEDTVLGLSFNGHWQKGQWKIDWMPTRLANGETISSGVLAYHQAWSWHNRSMSGFIEAFYNGFGETHTGLGFDQLNTALQKRLQRGQLFTQHRHYISLGVRAEITPLLNATLNALQNLDDASQRWLLYAQYTLSDFQQLRFGLQMGQGDLSAEWRQADLGFIQWVNSF